MDEINNHQEVLIERYFTHELNPTEKQEFEKQVQLDPQFAELVAFQHSLRKAIILPDQQFQDQVFNKLNKDSGPKWSTFIPVTLIVTAIGAFVYFGIIRPANMLKSGTEPTMIGQNDATKSKESIASRINYGSLQIPLPNFESMSSQSKEVVEIISPFLIPYQPVRYPKSLASKTLYEKGDFAEFLKATPNEASNSEVSTNEQTILLKANAHLFLGQLEPASDLLLSILNDPAAANLHGEAHYYLGLCRLHQEKIVEGKQHLQAITTGTKKEKAQEILNSLAENGR